MQISAAAEPARNAEKIAADNNRESDDPAAPKPLNSLNDTTARA